MGSWFWAPEYAQAREVCTRLVGLAYLLGFAAAVHQFRPLAGEHGLTPAPRFLRAAGFRRAPSLFHLHYSDRAFGAVAWTGVLLSLAAVLGVPAVLPLWAWLLGWLVLWVLYLSIVNIGQVWYGFGWESLLLEAGFLVIFLGPAHTTPPAPVLWLLCWLLFRVEFGAGLIKLRGDECWRDLTALRYHHETQPMPGPLSRFFHRLPGPLHQVEVLANHGTQLVVPFALFAPQPAADVAAALIVLTQCWLLLSGNFAWLNLVTIALACSAMDDRLLRFPAPEMWNSPLWHQVLVLALVAGMLVIARHPVRNMLGRHQVMNRSFNRLHLGGTYGAFGSVTRTRYEVVVEGTPDRSGESGWREYEFPGKPGDPRRRPPQVAPYHLRLGWLLWFVAIAPSHGRTWLPALLRGLLRGDRGIRRLLRHDPFPDAPPVLVRVRLYRYRFADRAERRAGRWWSREPAGDLLPPMSAADLPG
ncbi:lipase maturation factor family protein [Saccharopolyspora sp. NPDC047091]|uniref:lipase maturation factor family protein n=1 Tax=Saccharopolyspora sp. NPDC047091 TaxID=3155924 RepID=UPI0033CC78DF